MGHIRLADGTPVFSLSISSLICRSFVFENEMRGLSQYTHFMYIPAMHKEKERIQRAIYQYWQQRMKDKLSHLKSYIIDFVITLSRDGEDSIYLIELNPYHKD